MKRTLLGCTMMLAVLAAGCNSGRIDQPDGYLPIGGGWQYQQRYLSVEGNVVACRNVDNPKGGTLAYWSAAMEKELVGVAGYKLEASEDFAGGRLLELRRTIGGVEHTYLVALFVKGNTITIAEAGGESEKIAPDRKKLLESMRAAG